MLVIVCPVCGPRNSSEFTYLGEGRARPDDPDVTEWRAYLYEHDNTSGWQTERWFHVSGCRRFLDVERHNVTNEIRSTEIVGAGP